MDERRVARVWSVVVATVFAIGTCGGVSAAPLAPYNGSPAPVPGVIQAENFDNGGEGVAYHDSSAGNAGGMYRASDVDIAAASEGGLTVGWTTSGEWLNYTVNVAAAGSYSVQLRVATPSGGSMHVGFNGSNVWTTVSIPSSGGWQNWTTVSFPATLAAGQQVMTLLFDTGGVNLNYVNVVSAGAGAAPAGAARTLTPYSGSPAVVPGTIQAADFDNGGEGVAYHDASSGNAGGTYRSTDVDIAGSSEGGYTLGWISAGEWTNYTVNVASAGAYTTQLRVASPGGGGSLHIGFNRSSVWTTVTIPATGGWQTWATVNIPMTLSAGVQQMTLLFDTDGFNISSVRVASASAPPPPAASGGRLRMMTWNIQAGKSINSVYSLPSQVQLIAAQNPDVVVLQEVQTWDEYQPTRIPALLQQTTGQTWYTVWVPAPSCVTGGCIGELILSRIPIAASTTTYLGPSDAGRALIYVGNVPINILTNHLEYYDTALRTTELNGLMAWARGFGGPRLVGGDFNSWWGEWWISQMQSEYHDTWFDVTKNRDGGYTVGNVRFDYIFRAFDGDWRVTPTNVFVVSTTLSDHRPVVADFSVQ